MAPNSATSQTWARSTAGDDSPRAVLKESAMIASRGSTESSVQPFLSSGSPHLCSCSIPFLASLFGIRQQRVLAIIAIKEMEASAEPMIDPNAVVVKPSEAEMPDLDAEAGAETEEGVKLSGEGADEVSQDSDSSDSDDSEVDAKANMSIEECDSLSPVRADPKPQWLSRTHWGWKGTAINPADHYNGFSSSQGPSGLTHLIGGHGNVMNCR